jgi:8-oxo-dGTP pyrophosphatase MutT (NUDIX family)
MSKTKPLPPDAKMVFKGKIFEVWQWEQKMFDGTTETFERLKRPNTVQGIATVGDTILVQRQEQPDSAQPFLSLPGGRCDEGEEPLESAKRELLEETGYVSDDWSLWKEDDPVGKMQWTIYTFIARNCRKEREPHLDAGEKIDTKLMTFDEFLALSDDPSFRDLELVVPLLRARLDPSEKERLHAAIFGA